MKSKVYSFSANKLEDQDLVKELRAKYDKLGISFSWIVLQALKQYESNKAKESTNA